MKNEIQGLGLVELLVALMLSSLIIVMLVHYYIQIKQQYYHIEQQIIEQKDLQWVGALMQMSIRRAGFTPCSRIDNLLTADRRRGDAILMPLVTSTSSLTIHRMDEHFNRVLAVQNHGAILATNEQVVAPGDAVLLADCYHAEVQTVEAVIRRAGEQQIRFRSSLRFNYFSPFYVGAWIEESYSIKVNQDRKKALFYKIKHAEELSPVIQAFQTQVQHNDKKMVGMLQLQWRLARTEAFDTMVRSN